LELEEQGGDRPDGQLGGPVVHEDGGDAHGASNARSTVMS
jgi:hypothetical protein